MDQVLFQALEIDFKKVPALRELVLKCGDEKIKHKAIIHNDNHLKKPE